MGRTVAVIWHASFSLVAAGLYFFFVLPRWWELMGQISPTVGLVMRIVTGVVIGLAALPVVFTKLRTQRPEYGTPQLALTLRTVSATFHVVAGVLIIGTAISEIWLSLDDAGQWLFGIYGAAAAIALLGIFGFYLAFVAELPPPPPKPLKTRAKTERRGRGKADAEADETEEPEESTDTEVSETAEVTEVSETAEDTEVAEESEDDEAAEEAPADDVDEAESGKLRNRRPSNKAGASRLRRRSRGDIAVED